MQLAAAGRVCAGAGDALPPAPADLSDLSRVGVWPSPGGHPALVPCSGQ